MYDEDDEVVEQERWRFAPVATLIIISWVILTYPWWSGQWTVPWDAKAHFYPQLQFLARSIWAGEWPFWTPNVFSGWPQVADPQSLIFVPVFLALAAIMPDPGFIAMDMTVFGALLLGGLALAGWFRDRDWHPGGAAVAALAFCYGGSAYWRIQHTGQIVSFALLPIVMFLLARALERRSIFYGLLAGIFAGFLAIGRDQIALLSIYLLIGMTLVHILSGWRKFTGSILPLMAGAVGGIAVVVVPIALTWLLAQSSNRPEIDLIGAGKGSLHPASLITAYLADLFGQGAQGVDYWGPPSAAFKVTDIFLAQNMGAIYAGMLPALAILAFGVAKAQLLRPRVLLFTLFAAFCVVYALGWYTPGFAYIYEYLPGVKLYRRPADATFLIGFSIALLGGYAIHRYLTDLMPPVGLIGRVVQLALLGIVFGVLPYLFAVKADRLAEAILPWGTAIAFLLGAMVVLRFADHVAGHSEVGAAFLLVAFMTGDLWVNNAPNESTAYPPAMFTSLERTTADPTIGFLKKNTIETRTSQRRDRIEMVGLGFHWPNASLVHDLDNTLGYNPLRFKDYELATGARDHVALVDQRVFSPLMPSYHSTMANLLGLRYIAVGAPIDQLDKVARPEDLPLVAQFPGDPKIVYPGSWIYENPGALPRVAFVPEARRANFAQMEASGQWPEGYDPKRMTLLENGIPLGGDTTLAQDKLDSAVSIASYHNTSVTLDVDAPSDGYVLLRDMWHPWWKATLDGTHVPILRADVLFRAIPVKAGHHRIIYTFHPLEGALADYKRMLDTDEARALLDRYGLRRLVGM